MKELSTAQVLKKLLLTLAAMPLTYSIANGISLGLVSHTAIRVLTGRWREVHPLMLGVCVLLVLFYAWR